jgi:ubiquinone/menaquinone biosynthesis C-methylase UbiE
MSKKLVQAQFGANAEKYVTSTVHAKGASLARLLQLAAPQPTWQMLDVATGAGHTAITFAPFVAAVLASDITPEMLQQTAKLASERQISNLKTQYADAEALPFAAGSFDLVTCRIAPHHFPDIARFVQEAARVLKADGTLAVVDNVVPQGEAGNYINAFEKLRDPSHGRCLSLPEWRTNYEAAQLQVTHVETLDKTMDFEWWARRLTNDEATIEQLRQLLQTATGAAQHYLQPTQTADKEIFHLQEGLIIGRRF